MTRVFIVLISCLAGFAKYPGAQDSLLFKEQLSIWVQANPCSDYPFWTGVRYIPQVDYGIRLSHDRLVDFEAAINLLELAGLHDLTKAALKQ